MRKYDIVYILKADVPADELRYSLRSVEKNLVHRKVWFYCGKPKGIEPDEYVPTPQEGNTPYERTRSSMIEICKNNRITSKFWLFNDDFFILKPMESEGPYFSGTLRDHVLAIEKSGISSRYSRHLRQCEEMLKTAGKTTFDYTLHAPMLVDRKLMLEAIEAFPGCPMFRSIYGNYAMIGGSQLDDCKARHYADKIPHNVPFASTTEGTFKWGRAGVRLKALFTEPSRFEK